MNAIENTGLIFIAVLLLLVLSILLIRQAIQKKQYKNLLQKFDNFIIENDLTIDNKQRFNKNIIGIDRLNYVVVFFNDSIKKIHSVRLKDLGECNVITEKSGSGGYINQIFLKCNFKQKERGAIIFPFYNAHYDDLFTLMTISKRANTWAKRINIFREAAILKNQHRLSA